MTFTLKLKQETADKHKELDTHPYIKKMYNNTQDDYTIKINLKYYLDLHCILLDIMYNNIKQMKSYPSFVDQFNKGKIYKEMITTKLYNLNSVKNLISNISDDNMMAYCYAFYLGILYGGQIIKKLIKRTNDEKLINQSEILFEFNYDKKALINDIKNYLDNNVKNEDIFIKEVNKIYDLTKIVFTDFDFTKC
jgi:heme oxygenase